MHLMLIIHVLFAETLNALTQLEFYIVFVYRRRLPVVMVKNHMAETLKAAVTFIEQGRILHCNKIYDLVVTFLLYLFIGTECMIMYNQY